MTGPLDLPPDAPMCASGKTPYRTAEDADRRMRSARWQRLNQRSAGKKPGNPPEARIYQCPACSWWHATAMTTRRRERRR